MKIRVIKKTVTPNFPVYLAGFSDRLEKASSIHSDLEVNICQIQFLNTNIIIASFDLLFITEPLKEFFHNCVNETLKLTTTPKIILCASHTHYAPCIDDRSALGIMDENYYEFLKEKICSSLKELVSQEFNFCEIQHEKYKLNKITSSRRRKILSKKGKSKVVMEPDVCIRPNEILNVVSFISKGVLITRFVSFACHPTNLYDKNVISSEYISTIRKNFSDNNIPILFLQGFSGDLRAYPPTKYKFHRALFNLFKRSYPVKFYRFNKSQYNEWLFKISNSLIQSNLVSKKSHSVQKLLIKSINIPIKTLGIESKKASSLEITLIDFELFKIIFFSAEVLSGFERKINDLDFGNIICVGYCGHCFGYLPTLNNVREGGYEAEDFKDAFEVYGDWSESFEKTIFTSLEEIMKN
jgi:neutral ceramidase